MLSSVPELQGLQGLGYQDPEMKEMQSDQGHHYQTKQQNKMSRKKNWRDKK